ncbi:ATP-dependent helicase [Priestia megaterium]|uniref:ATP-dependent helicase n=1 Tax=Priestia megaterium TaxID=1404 RepID=UPI002E1F5A70|nr:ATP-dependent helicase [Priestia megaterium]
MIDNEAFRKNIACNPLTDSIVVQAGPGSGKTALLVERLKYIIKHNTNPLSNVACITYTNAAKDEIIMRLQNEKQQLPSELFIGTIHSFLLDFVIKPYSHFARKDNQSYKLAPLGFARGYKREIGQMLNRPIHFINENILRAFESLGHDEQGRPCCYANKIPSEIALQWKQLIRGKGYIDQQDVIHLSYLILNKNKHICNALSARFPYILVDEYQDVTFYQEKVFSLLENSSFFCVGDTNQSIYSFTGAKPEIFQAKWEHKEYKSYTLSNNFRSTAHIVKFANHKTEITQAEAGPNGSIDQKVLFVKNITEVSDVIQFFQRICVKIDCENQYKPYMILARQNNYVKQLAHFFKKQEGELNSFLKKLREEHYRRFQILNNLLLAISYKRRNEVDKAVERMAEAFSYLFFNEHPNYVALAEIQYDAFMWKKMHIFTLHFLDSLILTETSVEVMFQKLKEFISDTSKKLYGKPVGKKLLMLNYSWKGQVKASKSTMLSELIEQIDSQVDFSENEDYVMNIHSAKGQEAECVLVMAESESQLLDWLKDNLDSEEARVGYVAFSRARKLLCVWAPTIQEDKFTHLQQHIMFVDETYATQTEKV